MSCFNAHVLSAVQSRSGAASRERRIVEATATLGWGGLWEMQVGPRVTAHLSLTASVPGAVAFLLPRYLQWRGYLGKFFI